MLYPLKVFRKAIILLASFVLITYYVNIIPPWYFINILPEYLRNQATESNQVIDYRDWHVPLGRRFRALKLWFVIRQYGVEGLRYHVRRHVELAQRFAA